MVYLIFSSRTFTAVLAVIVLFGTLAALTPPIHASDDSNGGNLGLVNPGSGNHNTTRSTPTSENTIKALDQLSKGINDIKYQNLVEKLKNQLRQGNNTGAEQTLADLQRTTDTHSGSTVSPTALKLIESLKVQKDGLTVDPSLLSWLLGEPDSRGMPVGINSMDPAKAVVDLNTLSHLLQGIDPIMADSLSQDAFNIQDSLLHGLFGGTGGGTATPAIGNLDVPKVNPSIPTLTPLTAGISAGSPNIPILAPVIFIILFTIGTLFFLMFRKNRLGLPRRLPFARRLRSYGTNSPEKYRLNSPKDLIIYYFRKTTRIMGGRGVPKEHYETHREFSIKCTLRPEAEPVQKVSALYEKAMFSGRHVEAEDVKEAGRNLTIIESSPNVSKTR